MNRIRRSLTLVLSVSVGLWLWSTAASAQFSGDTSEIPENAPRNWTWEFLAWPVLILAIALVIGVGAAYVLKMVRVRYPKRASN